MSLIIGLIGPELPYLYALELINFAMHVFVFVYTPQKLNNQHQT